MITSYLDNGPERIAAVVDGGAAGDMARVERAAHTLKSSAGNVGAVRLGRACAALEEQAHGGIAASDLVQRVLQEYEHTVTELSRILEAMDP